jgi:hypothetical protein
MPRTFRSPVRRSRLSRLFRPSALGAVTLALSAAATTAQARNLMSADGPGGTPTYDLLHQAYTTELPDCGHMVPHITEIFDEELKKNVFVFHAHVDLDDDRCGGKDRQRTEIRAKAADIIAQQGETLYYRWKFKLDAKFQGSTRFTHIFQIKSDLGAPIMTLTPRVSTFGITGRAAGSSASTDLAKFLGVWVVVDLEVLFSDSGHVDLTIRRISDGQTLYAYSGNADMWDANASAHDCKFGIYRSLLSREMLRDEQVRFADFCASKVNAKECDDGAGSGTGGGGTTTPDAGTPADTGGSGGGAGGAAGGTGGSSSTGGAGGSSATGGTSGEGTGGASGGATGGASGSTTPPPRDASAPSPRPDPGTTTQEPTGEPAVPAHAGKAGGCSLGTATAGAGVASWLLVAGLALLRARRRR